MYSNIYIQEMEFPIEIQMLINDYARPLTRPDWRKGSFLMRRYMLMKLGWGRLDDDEFKRYLDSCLQPRGDGQIKEKAWTHERRSLNDYQIYDYKYKLEFPDDDADYGYDFYDN